MRRLTPRLGVMTVIREELTKLVPWLRYRSTEYAKIVKGQDNKTEAELEREERIKATLNAAPPQYNEAPRSEQRATLWETMSRVFGPKAGIAAIIDHCTKHHAAAVAVDLGVDVKSVQVSAQRSALGKGTQVVGYIDAPAASDEQVLIFAEKLNKACPAARMYGDVEWRRGPRPPP